MKACLWFFLNERSLAAVVAWLRNWRNRESVSMYEDISRQERAYNVKHAFGRGVVDRL